MLRRALNRALVPTAIGLGIGSPVYYYWTRQQKFDIPITVESSEGKRETQMKTIPILRLEDAESLLRHHAVSASAVRPNGLQWNHTTAFLPSNNPIEDANSHQIIRRDDATGDYLFFAVMDGHSGVDTSKLLSKTLIKATALELSALTSSPKTGGWLQSLWASKPSSPGADSDPKQVSEAIQRAFKNLDDEIVKTPIRLVTEAMDNNMRKNNIIPDISKKPLALQSILPAISGSCALMALFDTAHSNLYVACTGDSRAVAGVWEPSTDGKGTWRVDVLSEDQTGRNPAEVKRIQSEHPASEADSVVKNGRILGGLEPSRAFGDARYKWPRDIQAILNEAILVGNGKSMREPRPALKTPPYVIPTPVVTHRKLSFDKSSPGALRFLVLATDGLWDVLSSEEVVGLVGGHLAGLKGKVPKSDLQSLVPTTSSTPSTTSTIKSTRRQSTADTWAFVDDNVSTHLIRNALGGGDEMSLRRLLSIPAPYSRRFRDDITVTVVWWEQGREETAQVSSFAPPPPQAKL